MRKFLLVILMVFAAGVAYAEFKVETVADSLSVPLTTTVYTKSFVVKSNVVSDVGVAYKQDVATGTTVILFQQSFQRPETEQAADSNYMDTQAIGTASDGKWHMATIDTVVMPYGRFKLTGSGTNPATSAINIKVSKE